MKKKLSANPKVPIYGQRRIIPKPGQKPGMAKLNPLPGIDGIATDVAIKNFLEKKGL